MLTTPSPLWQRTLLLVGMTSVLLMGCNKPAEPDPQATAAPDNTAVPAETNANTAPVDTAPTQTSPQTTNAPAPDPMPPADNTAPPAEAEAPPDVSAATPTESLAGAQITDMRYQSPTGADIGVTFITSASGVLSARLTMPNQPAMTLDAPEGQGNNPTYRSADGRVQLVSHGGGSSIDVIVDNSVTSYDAVSADAKIVTQS
ncbi:hypothetical protein [Psychrobacter aestuarii]|uniref:Uncharacterized protein n=1 Tax=Psychrobacter aestuarii TaxID=556327 RepID=A0ABP3FBH5_9GAMM|nr:hypothetical protein [Psychrobacter aestuarii]